MSDTAKVAKIPLCDVHRFDYGERVPAVYDAKLPGKRGLWGFVCRECFEMYGPGRLGTGYGQVLVLTESAADIQAAFDAGEKGRTAKP